MTTDGQAIDGTRAVGSGLNDVESTSPFPVIHVTDNPEGGVTMARRNNDDRGEDTVLGDGRTEDEAQLDAAAAEEDPNPDDQPAEDEEPNGDEPQGAEDEAELEAEDSAEEPEDEAAEEDERKPSQMKRPYVFTPFQATKWLNQLLAAAGVKNADGTGPKEVGSPMLYIYARAKRFEIRRSPVDKALQAKDPDYMKGQKPRWEVWPLEKFKEWAEEYVDNQKKGITAAQARKKTQEAASAASDDTAEQDVAKALEASLAAIRDGNEDTETEAEDEELEGAQTG